jgi:hypothetical protein
MAGPKKPTPSPQPKKGGIAGRQERHTAAVRTMVDRDRRTDAATAAAYGGAARGRSTNRSTKPGPTGTPAKPKSTVQERADALKRQSGITGPVSRGPTSGSPPVTTRPTTTTTTVTPNARVAAERAARAAWVAKNPGKRYTRPVTPANTRSASDRGAAPPGRTGGTKAKATGVNKATQAVRDARAVSKAAGERYTRKAGGEKSVNAATQAKRLERATVRGQNRKGPVVIAPPPAAAARASQRGAVDWQQKANEYQAVPNQPGINPAWDINNADAKYQADANLKYRDYEGGTISAADIAKNLRAQLVAAMEDGKTQVVLPDGETWAAHQATLDQIDRNLAEMSVSETQRAARNA